MLHIPEFGYGNAEPGMDWRLDNYYYSKQTSTVLRYYLEQYDFFWTYNIQWYRRANIPPIVGNGPSD